MEWRQGHGIALAVPNKGVEGPCQRIHSLRPSCVCGPAPIGPLLPGLIRPKPTLTCLYIYRHPHTHTCAIHASPFSFEGGLFYFIFFTMMSQFWLHCTSLSLALRDYRHLLLFSFFFPYCPGIVCLDSWPKTKELFFFFFSSNKISLLCIGIYSGKSMCFNWTCFCFSCVAVAIASYSYLHIYSKEKVKKRKIKIKEKKKLFVGILPHGL